MMYRWWLPCLIGMVYVDMAHGEFTFDPSLLGGRIDIAELTQGMPPGIYLVDVLLNGQVVDTLELSFFRTTGSQLQTCLSKSQLLRYGVNVEKYPALFDDLQHDIQGTSKDIANADCADLSAIPEANVNFDFYSQQLRMSIPQIALIPQVNGIGPKELWDDGITALLMNYRVSSNYSSIRASQGSIEDFQWSAMIEPGLNVGPWRLRNSSAWQGGKWQSAYTYAERGLNDWTSRLTLGERFSSSMVLDGIPFTGAMLSTDENMVPYLERIPGPVVRGSARSQAKVEVRRNGYLIFSTNVAPGPFEFRDLPAGGGGGDLEVRVLETDGPDQEFTVTYALPAIALREGSLKYDLMVGYYRTVNQEVDTPPVGQFSVMYGFPLGLTAYTAGQFSTHYLANAIGLGTSLGSLGSLSADISHGRWQQRAQTPDDGHKWRLLYSKYIDTSKSWLSFESNIYSLTGFRTINEVLNSYIESTNSMSNQSYIMPWNLKRESTLTLGQSLEKAGNVTFSGTFKQYTHSRPAEKSIRFSYGFMVKGTSISLDWSENTQAGLTSDTTKHDTNIGMRLSYPLSLGQAKSTYFSYQMRNHKHGATNHELGLSGNNFDSRLNWDVRKKFTEGKRNIADSSLLNLYWNDKYGQLHGSYGYSEYSKQINMDASGGLVIHQDGLTLGQSLGETIGLVNAPDASDMVISHWPGVRTDPWGRTTLSSLLPYQINEIIVDPLSLPDDVNLSHTEAKIVPTSGAVVVIPFITRKGSSGMIYLTRPSGEAIPFGAVVVEDGITTTGMSIGIVGNEGDVYLSGMQADGRLLVRWGQASDEQCYVNYQLPETPTGFGGTYELHAICK